MVGDSRVTMGCEDNSMKEPLLSEGGGGGEDESIMKNLPVMWEEARRQFVIAGPMVGLNLLQFSLPVVSLMFVGHLGELSLSAASIATSFANVTGYQILMGMACALETLCGQAYGAKQYRSLGIFLQRAIFILLCTSAMLSFIWIYMDKILVTLGQDPAISSEAGRYARWMCPGLFAYAFLQPLVKFLQAQSIVMPMMLCSLLVLAFHAPLCWLLVFKVGLGTKGAALAIGISYWLNVVLLLLFILFSSSCKKTWTSLSMEALQNIGEFLRLAIPSAVMICLEYWSFEALVLMSGLLPNPELEMSVLSICLSTNNFAYMVPFGIGAAASTRISNELGAGRTRAARFAVKTAICIGLLEATVIGIIFISVRNVWGRAYSNEAEVIHYVSIMMPILAMSSTMDCLQGVLTGVARGCGWQKLGAYANLPAYYVIGIPAAVVLAFVFDLGGKGLWLGILCGLTTQTVLLSLITAYTNWSEQGEKAKERVHASALPVSDSNKHDLQIGFNFVDSARAKVQILRAESSKDALLAQIWEIS